MLRHIDSDELAEWMAYERAFGPLDGKWTQGALISIYKQLQLANTISLVTAGADEDDVPETPELLPPTEFYKHPELQGIEFEEDDDELDLGYEEV